MTNNTKAKPDTTAAEIRRGEKSRTVSQRGHVHKRTCWSRLGRNFVNMYIFGTGAGAVYMTSTNLPGDMAIHGSYAVGIFAAIAAVIVWWLEARKKE